MTCHYCGAELRENEIFCRHCGTRQQKEPQPAPAELIPAAPIMEEAFVPVMEETPAPAPATVYKEKTFDWQPYGAPAKEESLIGFVNGSGCAPKLQLPVKRSLAKMIFLGIITFGIYPMVIWSRMVSEVNIVASRYDGERSMPFFGMLMLSPITLGIHSLVWTHRLCCRMGNELKRRSIPYSFGASDFWIWAFLMSLLGSICVGVCTALAAFRIDIAVVTWVLLVLSVLSLVGPFVFIAKIMRAINALNQDFNLNG